MLLDRVEPDSLPEEHMLPGLLVLVHHPVRWRSRMRFEVVLLTWTRFFMPHGIVIVEVEGSYLELENAYKRAYLSHMCIPKRCAVLK